MRWHTAGPKVAAKATMLNMKMGTDVPINAFRPRVSKCCGQTGSHHGFVVCSDVKVCRTWPAHAVMAMDRMMDRTVKASAGALPTTLTLLNQAMTDKGNCVYS